MGLYLKFFQATVLRFFIEILGLFTHIGLGLSYILCVRLFVRHLPHFHLFPELFVSCRIIIEIGWSTTSTTTTTNTATTTITTTVLLAPGVLYYCHRMSTQLYLTNISTFFCCNDNSKFFASSWYLIVHRLHLCKP